MEVIKECFNGLTKHHHSDNVIIFLKGDVIYFEFEPKEKILFYSKEFALNVTEKVNLKNLDELEIIIKPFILKLLSVDDIQLRIDIFLNSFKYVWKK